MAEWFKATVLKTVECNSSQSSNLCPSAKYQPQAYDELGVCVCAVFWYGIQFQTTDPLASPERQAVRISNSNSERAKSKRLVFRNRA